MKISFYFGTSGPQLADAQNTQIQTVSVLTEKHPMSPQNGGYARASYASGGGGASRVPRIAGDVTAGSALVSCVLVSYAPCAERRRF